MKFKKKIVFTLLICLSTFFISVPVIGQDNHGNLKEFSVTIGGKYNLQQGSFINLSTGKVWSLKEATKQQKDIDLLYAYGTGSKKNLFTPKSTRVRLFGYKLKHQVANKWTTKNRGYLKNIHHSKKAEKLFQSIKNRADLVDAYKNAKNFFHSFPNYKRLRDGPAQSIRYIRKGDVILFKSRVKDLYAIAKVIDFNNGYDGDITLEFKVANN